jgi:hypothetical protein
MALLINEARGHAYVIEKGAHQKERKQCHDPTSVVAI